MPPVYQLNHPPHPFWDFVQEMNEHPFWRGPQQPPQPQPQQEPQQPEASRSTPKDHPQEKNDQSPADDPPEVDPSTLPADPCKQARRCARRCGREQARRGHDPFQRGGWPGWGGHPFMMAGGPFGGHHGPRGHHHPPPPPPPPFGFHGRGGPHRRGGPHHHGGPHGGPHGHLHGHHHPPPPQPFAGFNLGNFLNDLGERIGVDLNRAAEGLGIDRFMPSTASPDVDFEPKVDIFDLEQQFVIHASLPGARKDDVGVDWEGEHSVLRIAGVVHRPEADEQMLQHLAVDGRKREVGVFEKNIRLGTQNEPANIDIAGIKAKMTDGVLVVKIPKVEKTHHKRDVPISNNTPSPPRYQQPNVWEDEEMYDVAPESVQNHHPVLRAEKSTTTPSRTVSVEPHPVHETEDEKAAPATPTVEKSKTAEVLQEEEKVQSSSPVVEEPLPTYQAAPQRGDSDWDESSSEEEGEYVKINVD